MKIFKKTFLFLLSVFLVFNLAYGKKVKYSKQDLMLPIGINKSLSRHNQFKKTSKTKKTQRNLASKKKVSTSYNLKKIVNKYLKKWKSLFL